MENNERKQIADMMARWKISPFAFIKDVFGLTPQPPKPEFKDNLKEYPWKWKAEWFGTCLNEDEMTEHRRWSWYKFDKYNAETKSGHLTWQQTAFFLTIQRAMQYRAEGNEEMAKIYMSKISIKAGKGMGKSCMMALLIIWYFFCHSDSITLCTAPSKETLEDALWGEVGLWFNRMNSEFLKNSAEYQSHKLVMKEGNKWYVRARTADKNSEEALAGVHADHMLIIADEASGVDDKILKNALDTLTGDNHFFLMISNPVRLTGQFFRAFEEEREQYVNFSFNTEQSPVVSEKSLTEKIDRNRTQGARDSDDYKTSVVGEFPKTDDMDAEGYVRLLNKDEILKADSSRFVGTRFMGVDPAGEGTDETIWVVRDSGKAQIVWKEQKSDPAGIAEKTATLMTHYMVNQENVFIDNFGIGANVGFEMAKRGYKKVNPIYVGEKDYEDDTLFSNLKAGSFWRLRLWALGGGKFIPDDMNRWDELNTIRYREEASGKLKIMGKKDMRKKYGDKSPNAADALMLTFSRKPKRVFHGSKFVKPAAMTTPEYGF